jgi:hypothetical protein
MVLDQSTVVFQITYKKSQVWKTLIVKVDRNQYLTLNRCPLGNYERKTEQIQIRQL